MTLVKSAIALLALGGVLAICFYLYAGHSQAPPSEPARPHKITLTWNAAPHAVSYNIYRRPYRSDSYTKLASSAVPSYEDSAVQSAERYCYETSSVDAKGRESARSTEICVTVPRP